MHCKNAQISWNELVEKLFKRNESRKLLLQTDAPVTELASRRESIRRGEVASFHNESKSSKAIIGMERKMTKLHRKVQDQRTSYRIF